MENTLGLNFQSKTVMITGASSGIGFAVAHAFARHGASLEILALDETVHKAAKIIAEETGQKVRSHVCDITNNKQVKRVFQSIDRIDIFVANAGLEAVTPITDPSPNTEALFRRVIDINVIGTYLTTKAAIPHMPTNSSIIITASIWGTTAVPELSAYVASKHANIGFMRSLAKELGPAGIRVNAVCPGWVLTGPALNTLKKMCEERGVSEAVIHQEISDEQSLPKVQEADDVALSYLYLASPLAANITGQKLNADRGAVQG